MTDEETIVQVLSDIAEQLADHIEDDLLGRAEQAAADLTDECRTLAVALLLQREARRIWRERTLAHERAAQTVYRQPEPDQVTPVPVMDDNGHTGPFSPGSCAKRNRCECAICVKAKHEFEEELLGLREAHWKRMIQLEEDYARELKMEWTAELLAAGFALPNGKLVTWADATIDQHQARVEMLRTNAIANAEAAVRHTKAMETIREAGALTLAQALGTEP